MMHLVNESKQKKSCCVQGKTSYLVSSSILKWIWLVIAKGVVTFQVPEFSDNNLKEQLTRDNSHFFSIAKQWQNYMSGQQQINRQLKYRRSVLLNNLAEQTKYGDMEWRVN